MKLAHPGRSHWRHGENVSFFGTIDVDVESELAKLDGSGYRPRRTAGPAD